MHILIQLSKCYEISEVNCPEQIHLKEVFNLDMIIIIHFARGHGDTLVTHSSPSSEVQRVHTPDPMWESW